LEVTAINKDSAVLNWEPSPNDGGTPITHYLIEKRDASRNNWIGIGRVPVDKTTFTAPKLWEGCDYLFRIAAENAVGASDYVQLEKPVTAKLPFGEWLLI
jgi:titin